MHKYSGNIIIYTGLATAASIPFTIKCTESPKDEKSNIVFIYADDMGYSDLSCYGECRWETENIDRLAAEGVRFTNFYSASSLSSPSRAALLTGRYPARMGIHGVFFPTSFSGMSPKEVTIAELLEPSGYTSGIIGKWHLGHMKRYLTLQQGFDEYFGLPYSNDMAATVYLRETMLRSLKSTNAI